MSDEDVKHKHSGILLSDKPMTFAATWMKVEGVSLSKQSQKEKEKHGKVSFICVI